MTRRFWKRLFSHRQKQALCGRFLLYRLAETFPKYPVSAGLEGLHPHTFCLGWEPQGSEKPVMYSRAHSQRSCSLARTSHWQNYYSGIHFITAVFQWFKTERINLKSEYSGHWAKVTFVHFLKGLGSMWKFSIGGVSNMFIYVNPSLQLCLCSAFYILPGMKPQI